MASPYRMQLESSGFSRRLWSGAAQQSDKYQTHQRYVAMRDIWNCTGAETTVLCGDEWPSPNGGYAAEDDAL